MSPARLFLALVLSAASASAQSQPGNTPNPAPPAVTVDLFRINLEPPYDFTAQIFPQTAAPQIEPQVSAVSGQDHSAVAPPRFAVAPAADCLAIRSYRVVRDSPHSDSTHFDSYTTCVPAARFRYYTAVARER